MNCWLRLRGFTCVCGAKCSFSGKCHQIQVRSFYHYDEVFGHTINDFNITQLSTANNKYSTVWNSWSTNHDLVIKNGLPMHDVLQHRTVTFYQTKLKFTNVNVPYYDHVIMVCSPNCPAINELFTQMKQYHNSKNKLYVGSVDAYNKSNKIVIPTDNFTCDITNINCAECNGPAMNVCRYIDNVSGKSTGSVLIKRSDQTSDGYIKYNDDNLRHQVFCGNYFRDMHGKLYCKSCSDKLKCRGYNLRYY